MAGTAATGSGSLKAGGKGGDPGFVLRSRFRGSVPRKVGSLERKKSSSYCSENFGFGNCSCGTEGETAVAVVAGEVARKFAVSVAVIAKTETKFRSGSFDEIAKKNSRRRECYDSTD